ncbi:SAM-dependent methyltransferase [Limnobacter humi]|uniref:SAM-dependent methyltransferase n=1 Tax=Limnobacter humi TaxID=1778671 RepID=A0ABT1WEH4_9BURK|nr:SAM-dependent methyltransferase [Limnobacter humi]MCQ8895917.1 SAM-dependent methyltransferase [Limnobacter humi]
MLILVPSPLSQKTPTLPLLQADLPLVRRISTWVVENAKPARAALALMGMDRPIRELNLIELATLDEGTRTSLLRQATAEAPIGLMSDAGCPAIADPGADLVRLAHDLQCPVHPLVGPSAILMTLMGSGLNGQCFTFHGYPPVDPNARDAWLAATEKTSKIQTCTQLAIETPFRNERLIEALLKILSPSTRLCVAWDLTGAEMRMQTKRVADWRKQAPSPGKFPCMFAWLAD